VLIGNAMVAIVGGLICGWVCIKVLSSRLKALEQNDEKRAEKLDKITEQVGALEHDRTRCELRAANTFCTRNELVRLTIDTGKQYDDVIAKMESGFKGVYKRIETGLKDVHQRINLLAPEARAKATGGKAR